MSKILNLKQYDLIFTTSFFFTHGVSGHLYEMIDYYHICSTNGIKCGILLADGVTKEVFKKAVQDKYNFSKEELYEMLNDTTECYRPKIIMANNICLVDGSWRMLDCTVYADNAFLLRCSEPNFKYFHDSKTIKQTHLMQDFKLYPERFEDLRIKVVDYVKKLLWSKYYPQPKVKTDTALLYLTTSMRAIPVDDVKNIIDKAAYKKYLIITNDVDRYRSLVSDNVIVERAPVSNIFEKFDTYIYTSTRWKIDCSPRFIVECALYGKEVVYEIDYQCSGIERRKEDIKNNFASLELKSDDFFISYVKSCTQTNHDQEAVTS